MGDMILFGFVTYETISVREYFCAFDALRGQRSKPLLGQLLDSEIACSVHIGASSRKGGICCDVCGPECWDIP